MKQESNSSKISYLSKTDTTFSKREATNKIFVYVSYCLNVYIYYACTYTIHASYTIHRLSPLTSNTKVTPFIKDIFAAIAQNYVI